MPTRSQIIPNDGGGSPVQFITLRGTVQIAGQRVTNITRPGIDGDGFRLAGYHGEPFQMLGILDCTDFPAAAALHQDLRDMLATLVSVYDDFGTIFDKLILLSVRHVSTRPALASIGGVSGATAGAPVALATFEFGFQSTFIPAH